MTMVNFCPLDRHKEKIKFGKEVKEFYVKSSKAVVSDNSLIQRSQQKY